MDHFGIGAAIAGAVRIYLQSAKGTGRTTSLVESVKDGDRIVFIDSTQAKRAQRLCQERGATVDCVVIDPRQPDMIYQYPPAVGRTIFDHVWVEQFYLHAIERCQQDIDHLERRSSGFGAAHRETQRAIREMDRWR